MDKFFIALLALSFVVLVNLLLIYLIGLCFGITISAKCGLGIMLTLILLRINLVSNGKEK